MAGSLSVRKKNAEKRRVTKGQSLSVRKPGVVETLYDYLDVPLAALGRRLGMSEGEAYEYSKRLSGGVEGLTGAKATEQSGRNIVGGRGGAEDYLNVGMMALPAAVKPVAKAVKAAKPAVRAAESAPLAVKPTVAATPRSTVGALLAAEPTGIIAYHGSPHSFDRFDISKIGTGEGAQSYGHGLYFAEAEPVAQEYRQRLAEVTAAPFDRIGIPPNEWNAATMFARQMDPTLPDIAARDFAAWTGRDVTPELIDAFKTAKTPGSMYQVRINADPIKFLDWDKPYKPDALEALAANFDSVDPVMRRTLEDWAYENSRRGIPMPDGQDIISKFGGVTGTNARALSETLKNAGIPGIKYLDQGSRGAGEGSRNYVVFDDALIDLLRKYAIGGAVNPSPSQ